jgi:hypothetical protein
LETANGRVEGEGEGAVEDGNKRSLYTGLVATKSKFL